MNKEFEPELPHPSYPIITKDEFANEIDYYKKSIGLLKYSLPAHHQKYKDRNDPILDALFQEVDKTLARAIDYMDLGIAHYESARAEYNLFLALRELIHCHLLRIYVDMQRFNAQEHAPLLDMLVIEGINSSKSALAKMGALTLHEPGYKAKKRACELAGDKWSKDQNITLSKIAKIIKAELKSENPAWQFEESTIISWVKKLQPAQKKKGGRPKKAVVQ